jgi:predicted phage terminase large subunit-like protein
LLNRRHARRNLIAFTEETNSRYQPAQHHRIIAEQLERVSRGDVDRLMLLVPPRHGKSELASRRFPAFHLGQHPGDQFIAASATADLAGDFGRDVKEIVSSEGYGRLFPGTTLAEDSQAKGKWHTNEHGIYYSVGVGGAVLGRGADIALIDDPFATMEDAQSQTIRDKVWRWYNGTIYNRLMPGGRIVVINHRMHQDDLCGRLIDVQAAGGDQWEIVELPAIDEAGDALWPEWYPIERLERIKRTYELSGQSVHWSALYQQSPTVEAGDYFNDAWFRSYIAEPAHLTYYGASDFAVTKGDGDWTVHIVVGVDPNDNLYVVDVWRKRVTPDVSIEAMLDMHDDAKTVAWGLDGDLIQKTLAPMMRRRVLERQSYITLQMMPMGRRDKRARAQAFRARAAMGKVYLPQSAPWLSDFKAELLAFDNGKHDDQVDACGLIGRMLSGMVGAHNADDRPPIDYLGDYVSSSEQYDPENDWALA